MKNNNLINESLEEAGKVASMKDIYIYATIGGVLRGIGEKSFAAGLKYATFGIGAQIIWNVAARRAYSEIVKRL